MYDDDYGSKIQQHVARLTTIPYSLLEAEVARKRLDWFAAHGAGYGAGAVSPRRAYEILFEDYMGLDLADIPVIEENGDAITWLSRNACPTQAACVQAGLDTRLVCRAVYERTTQVLISCLDPQLRFWRSYTEIRPHAEACREGLLRVDFNGALAQAREEAQLSAGGEGDARGALVLLGRQVLGRGHGPQAAAAVLRRASGGLGDENLCGALLFCTHEPDPAGLAAAARVTSIVFPTGDGAWAEVFPAFPDVRNRGPRRP